jgi:hypothetical protein
MRILMLRGQIPQDRNPQEIVFDQLHECDDMWTQLVAGMTYPEDVTELWYWGGRREKKFRDNFTERWVPSFQSYKNNFVPDVIFCRGGFPEFHAVLNRFPKAIKIYYGAGRRFLPLEGFQNYDILLQDSPTQLAYSQEEFPNIKSSLFFKPAPDDLFYYTPEVKKEYDLCYPADGRPDRKGHGFVYPTVPKHLKVLNLGFPTKRVKKPTNVDSYRVLKPQLAAHMQKCKVGIVACTNGTGLFGLSYDSCPRVIPEMLACNMPIVVLDELEFWADKYITSMTGKLASRKNFWSVVEDVLHNYKSYSPRTYYLENLNTYHAAAHLRKVIHEVSV